MRYSIICTFAVLIAVAAVAAPQQPAQPKAKAPAVVENYPVHPDTERHDGVPKGTLTKQPEWKSQVFPDTVRDWWIYVPAQYKADGPPAAVMVFQDGGGYINAPVHVPIVFDNLIHRGDMPVTVGVFVNPGDVPKDGQRNRQASNRSFEYDTLSDQYSQISTFVFSSKKFCRPSRRMRTSSCGTTRRTGRSAADRQAGSVPGRRRGKNQTSSARSGPRSAASRTSAAATVIPG
jgi:hypothetical protein